MTEETVIFGLRRDGYSLENIGEFLNYHKKNPLVWKYIQVIVFEMIKDGAKRIGLKDVFEQLRKHPAIKKSDSGFKVNNNFTSYFGRLLILKYKNLEPYIELRQLQQKEAQAA